MKKVMILLAVAALSAAPGCCCTRLCPCCPCNWFARPAAVCPPTYAAPLAASPCGPTYVPSPCAAVGTVAPMAGMMPQYMQPQAAPMFTQAQPMYYQSPMPQTCCGAAPTTCCAPEPSCSYAPNCGCGYGGEPGCGGPMMGNVGYGPMMDCGGCGGCDSGCSGCGGGAAATGGPTPIKEFTPEPAAE